jgi:hypothetical protein
LLRPTWPRSSVPLALLTKHDRLIEPDGTRIGKHQLAVIALDDSTRNGQTQPSAAARAGSARKKNSVARSSSLSGLTAVAVAR